MHFCVVPGCQIEIQIFLTTYVLPLKNKKLLKVWIEVETGSGHLGQTSYFLYGSTESDPGYKVSDLNGALTALLEYFNILAHTSKVYRAVEYFLTSFFAR